MSRDEIGSFLGLTPETVSRTLSAFQAGLMTFASAAAALAMKTVAPPILLRFGFKTTLSVNTVIVAVSFMAYALFTPTTPHAVIILILVIGGFFRSLQFTSLNGLAFADAPLIGTSRRCFSDK